MRHTLAGHASWARARWPEPSTPTDTGAANAICPRHHAARPAGTKIRDVAPVDQRRERAGLQVDQRDEIARAHTFGRVLCFRRAEFVGMIGGKQDAHPATAKAGGEARRNNGLARRLVAKDLLQKDDAVAIGQDPADGLVVMNTVMSSTSR